MRLSGVLISARRFAVDVLAFAIALPVREYDFDGLAVAAGQRPAESLRCLGRDSHSLVRVVFATCTVVAEPNMNLAASGCWLVIPIGVVRDFSLVGNAANSRK
jgi:hypothetical protein